MVASQMYPKEPLLLNGIEIDTSLYRACLVNMALFSHHPYSILCADTLMIDAKYCGPGSEIWALGNRWDPPSMTPYYWKPVEPFKWSLKVMAKAVKERPVDVDAAATEPEKPVIFSLAEYGRAKKKSQT